MQVISVYVSVGSAQSYPAIMRLPKMAKEHGLFLRWHPVDLDAFYSRRASVFYAYDSETEDRFWRSIKAFAAEHGIGLKNAPPYPIRRPGLANRIAIVAMREGWIESYLVKTYHSWFCHGQEPGSEQNLEWALPRIQQERNRIKKAADSDVTLALLKRYTDRAIMAGVKTLPTFAVGDVLFSGANNFPPALNLAVQLNAPSKPAIQWQ